MPTQQPIVVGYDGSDGADAALRWALDDAARTNTAVVLVYAFEWRTVAGQIGLMPTAWPDDSAREEAHKLIAAALARAGKLRPEVTVSGTVVDGTAAGVLVDLSYQASLTVLGARGRSAFADLLVGSASVAVSAHAHCPVVVVRGEPATRGPVVVGFDGSDCAQLAVEFAFAQAALRGSELRLVHAWARPAPYWQLPEGDVREGLRAEQTELEQVLLGWRGSYPQVSSSVHVVTAPPSPALVDASDGAQLVVVGSRGQGGFRGLLLGSVSQQLLHYAHCPVAVVRERPARM
ncbi:universal stress protein [Phytohabitans houttuyneae]|uniref:Universal stress protein n=1 Tax=Phytohabitans houttuyneae TaxID=1076126 RepID=A0A6V8KE16_9ACTN|nr:universal stress protein [Phytohabitans houttuyneae]GFJ81670.1 universal stress protein [Phytohabitans houttuyneae]